MSNGTTKAFQIRLASVVGAIVVLAFVYALFIGLVPVPEIVASSFWVGVIAIITVGTGYLQVAAANRKANETQDKLNALGSRIEDGLKGEYGAAAAAAVRVDNEATAAALLIANQAAEVLKVEQAAAIKAREDLAALTGKFDAWMLMQTPPTPAPVAPAPAALVAPNGDELSTNTAAVVANTDATITDTATRVTALEEIVKPPEEV